MRVEMAGVELLTIEKKLSAEEYEGLLHCSTAVYEGRRIIYDFSSKMPFMKELLQAAGRENDIPGRLPADAGAFFYLPSEEGKGFYERLEGQVVHYGKGPFNERMVFAQLLRAGYIFIKHDAKSELANDTLPFPEAIKEDRDMLVTFDEFESMREGMGYCVRFNIAVGKIFWPDAIRAVANAKIYYIYRRNYPCRHDSALYRSEIIAVLDETGTPADKSISDEIMMKYRFSELI